MNIVEWFEQLLLFGLHVPLTGYSDSGYSSDCLEVSWFLLC